MTEATRIVTDMSFIEQTLNPQRNNTRPSPIHNPVGITKNVDVNAQWTVSDPAGLQFEQVQQGTGVILYFPKSHVAEVLHMGIVPKSTASLSDFDNANGIPRLGTVNILTDYSYVSPAVTVALPDLGAGVGGFFYNKALAVPRIETGISTTFSPDLSIDFSKVRTFGGVLKLWSTTSSNDSRSFNGTCYANAQSDTRDLCQNATGSDCFSIVDMKQQARNYKERVSDIPIDKGVLTLMGPDIPQDYKAPNSWQVDKIHGEWQDLSTTYKASFKNAVANMHTVATALGPDTMHSFWISPWDVDCLFNGASRTRAFCDFTANAKIPGVTVPPIEEMGYLDIDVDVPIYIDAVGTGSGQANRARVDFVVQHWFVSVGLNDIGSLNYQTIEPDVFTYSFDDVDAADGPLTGSQDSILNGSTPTLKGLGTVLRIRSRPAEKIAAAGGINVLGKYVGSKIFMVSTTTAKGGLVPNLGYSVRSDYIKLAVRARRILDEGRTGPVHILRYEGVGAEQRVHLKGYFNCECVAKGNLAPYIQENTVDPKVATDMNVYPVVDRLYNGVSPFKCTWCIPEWEKACELVARMSPEQLLDWSQKDGALMTACEASGLFANLGRAAGGALGSILGNEQLGRNIGEAAGYVGDGIVGARGSFASGSTYAQGSGSFGSGKPYAQY